MDENEIKKIEEGISYTYGKRGSTAEGAANVRAEYCRNLIAALRAERKATEKLAEELGDASSWIDSNSCQDKEYWLELAREERGNGGLS